MPTREEVVPKLLNKTEPFADSLARDAAEEHDIFPALLWVLLKSDENLNRSIETLNQARVDDQKATRSSLEAAEHVVKNSEQKIRELIEALFVSANANMLEDRRTLAEGIEKLIQASEKNRDSVIDIVKQATEYLTRKNQESSDQILKRLRNILLAVGFACGIAGIAMAILLFQLIQA